MRQTAPNMADAGLPSNAGIREASRACDDEIRTVVEHMLCICRSASATEDEKQRAWATIQEALFAVEAAACDGLIERLSVTPDAAARERRLDAEEQAFAERLLAIMASTNVTTDELARRSGLDPDVVSIFLSGRSRPQQCTVRGFAEALGVAPDDLWPVSQPERR